MRLLEKPDIDPLDVYDSCVGAVAAPASRQNYIANRAHLIQAVADFDTATAAVAWAGLPRAPFGHPEFVVRGTLTKKQMMDLYSEHMVTGSAASRKVYDDIFVAAGGLCPFCGGLGHVFTLDHYLPKAFFPIYSVLPANLVPCCRDCNTGKGAGIGGHLHEQALHPYLDDNRFFEQRWVVGTVLRTKPVVVQFECAPPIDWSPLDKLRVAQHFVGYNLAGRFSIQAGAELSRLVELRKGSLRVLPPESFRSYLRENAESAGFDLNGWSRTMYAALVTAPWFAETDFTNPDWHLDGA